MVMYAYPSTDKGILKDKLYYVWEIKSTASLSTGQDKQFFVFHDEGFLLPDVPSEMISVLKYNQNFFFPQKKISW